MLPNSFILSIRWTQKFLPSQCSQYFRPALTLPHERVFTQTVLPRPLNRARIIALIVILLLGGMWAIHLLRTKEPAYQGRSLSQWLKSYHTQQDPSSLPDPANPEVADSVRAVRAIGTNALPHLLKILAANRAPGSVQLESLAHRLGWKRFSLPHAPNQRGLALRGFTILGPHAAPAAPALIQLAESGPNDQRYLALWCLEKIQPEKQINFPMLTQLLADTNTGLADYAAHRLLELYPNDAEKAGVYNRFYYLRPKPPKTNSLKSSPFDN
jgi:hypothetical protein